MDCPSIDALLAHDESPSGGDVSRHVAAGCRDCDEILRSAREMRSLLAPGALDEPPEWAVSRAGRLASEPDAPDVAFAAAFAELVFDASRDPLPIGLRSAVPGATAPGAHHMLYRAPSCEVAVRVTPSADGTLRLAGQLLPTTEGGGDGLAGVEVALTRPRGDFRATRTDDLGEFAFDDVGDDEFTLVVEAPSFRVLVERRSSGATGRED